MLALLSVRDHVDRGGRVEVQAFGFIAVAIYLISLFLKMRALAGWTCLAVALYCFVADFGAIPLGLTDLHLAFMLGTVLKFGGEMLFLVQGYFGLCTLDEETILARSDENEIPSPGGESVTP